MLPVPLPILAHCSPELCLKLERQKTRLCLGRRLPIITHRYHAYPAHAVQIICVHPYLAGISLRTPERGVRCLRRTSKGSARHRRPSQDRSLTDCHGRPVPDGAADRLIPGNDAAPVRRAHSSTRSKNHIHGERRPGCQNIPNQARRPAPVRPHRLQRPRGGRPVRMERRAISNYGSCHMSACPARRNP